MTCVEQHVQGIARGAFADIQRIANLIKSKFRFIRHKQKPYNPCHGNAPALDMLKLMQMEAYASRRPAQLSAGQQQRVALARALAIEPQVLLLDEPLSALDAKIRVSLREEIRAVQRNLGITTIYVTHDQEEAMTLGDRIVVMGARDEDLPPLNAIAGRLDRARGNFLETFPLAIVARMGVVVAGNIDIRGTSTVEVCGLTTDLG